MSRGLGKVQRMCLSVLTEQDKMLDSIEVAAFDMVDDAGQFPP